MKTPAASDRIPGSFRDPSGFVCFRNGKVYRYINVFGKPDFERFCSSGLADELVKREWLLPFEPAGNSGTYTVIEPEYVPFITYPYEWSFSQLRDAAILTLDINLLALEYGFILKDASAFNIVFHRNRMVFIDHTSIVPYREGDLWHAYKQFCCQFCAPLLLMKYVDFRCLDLLKSDIDGINLEFASRMLPWRSYFSLTSLLHIHLHARMDVRYSSAKTGCRRICSSKDKLRKMLMCLRYELEKLSPDISSALWYDYYSNTNYTDASFASKKKAVADFCRRKSPQNLLDLGANSGVFSEIALEHAQKVISADYDAGAVEQLYRLSCKRDGRIIPVRLDLFNPAPSLGIFNEERASFFERCKADCVLGLALIHHLRVTGNWRIADIVKLFSVTGNSALVEFVPLEDSQMRRLVRGREMIYSDWTLQNVVRDFEQVFRHTAVIRIDGTQRVLIELEK